MVVLVILVKCWLSQCIASKTVHSEAKHPFSILQRSLNVVDALFIWQRNTGKSKRVNMTSVSSALSGRFLCNIDFRAPHRFFCPSQKVIQWRGQSSIRHGWMVRTSRCSWRKSQVSIRHSGKLKFGKNEVSQWENSWSSWENGVGSAPLQPCPQGAESTSSPSQVRSCCKPPNMSLAASPATTWATRASTMGLLQFGARRTPITDFTGDSAFCTVCFTAFTFWAIFEAFLLQVSAFVAPVTSKSTCQVTKHTNTCKQRLKWRDTVCLQHIQPSNWAQD